MQEPVMTITSQTYERKAIEQWFNEVMARCGSFRDPITNLRLHSRDLKPNYALKSAIDEYTERRRKETSARDKGRNEVIQWLKELSLAQYAHTFTKEGFDRLEALALLRPEDLSNMSVKKGHARIILNNLPRSSRPPAISAQVKRRLRLQYHTPSKSPRKTSEDSPRSNRSTGDRKDKPLTMDEEFEVGLELEHSSSDKTSSWGKAYPHYVKAMKLWHSIAYLKVGLCHLFGMHATRIDYRKGALFVKEAVRRGVKEAELWLGYCYGFGKGFPRDQKTAIELLIPDQKAAILDKTTQECQDSLDPGDFLELGDGLPHGLVTEGKLNTEQSRTESEDLQPSIFAPTNSAKLKFAAKSNPNLPPLSTQEALSMLFAAISYHRGGYGIEKDTERAKYLYHRSISGLTTAASKGDPFAQNSLGVCYQYGTGVSQSFSKAVEYYAAAGVLGHADAQYSLGVSYHDGKGLHKNEEKAVVMYSAAARQGHPTAQAILGWCFVQRIASHSPRTGRAVRGRKDQCQKAIELWSNSAENGNCALAQYSMGLCCETGRAGMDLDLKQALRWYQRASEQDFSRAQMKLRELELSL